MQSRSGQTTMTPWGWLAALTKRPSSPPTGDCLAKLFTVQICLSMSQPVDGILSLNSSLETLAWCGPLQSTKRLCGSALLMPCTMQSISSVPNRISGLPGAGSPSTFLSVQTWLQEQGKAIPSGRQ